MKLTLIHKFALEDVARSPGRETFFWRSKRTVGTCLPALKEWGLIEEVSGAWHPTAFGLKCLKDRSAWADARVKSERGV